MTRINSLPPGPPNAPFGSNHLRAMREDLLGFGARLGREFGDVAYFRLGPLPCYQLLHPDHVHEVLVLKAKAFRKPKRLRQVFGRFEGQGLVVSEGDLWVRQRRLVQTAFHPSRLHGYSAEVVDAATAVIDAWEGQAEVDFSREMMQLALCVVTQTLFSTSVADVMDELADAVAAIQHWSIRELNRVAATPQWLPLWAQPRARRAVRFLDGLVWRIIQDRQASSQTYDDLLGRLLTAVDAEGDGRRMTPRQARDEVVTLLLAGHETLGVALAWAGWLLARHLQVQEELSAEVRNILGTRPPTAGDLPRLRAVEQAFQEALRLYPPVYVFSREAAEVVEVGGYRLRPGSQVFLSPFLTQRDPRWFCDPDRFDPARFCVDWERRVPACAWFPFGAGPRACIGRSFAMMEGTLVLTLLLQRCRLLTGPHQQAPPFEQQLSLHPKGGIRLRAECR